MVARWKRLVTRGSEGVTFLIATGRGYGGHGEKSSAPVPAIPPVPGRARSTFRLTT